MAMRWPRDVPRDPFDGQCDARMRARAVGPRYGAVRTGHVMKAPPWPRDKAPRDGYMMKGGAHRPRDEGATLADAQADAEEEQAAEQRGEGGEQEQVERDGVAARGEGDRAGGVLLVGDERAREVVRRE
eukprot:7383330-Prymnesium_polylepis.1